MSVDTSKAAVVTTVTVSKDAAGRYFVSMLCSDEVHVRPEVAGKVGIDLGLTHFAILSTGEKVSSPKAFAATEKRLARAQRALAKKQMGSANRRKAKLKVARLHAKIADTRKDFLHKLSTRLIRENQAVVIEDLAVENLTRRCAPKPDPEHPGRYLPNGQAAKTGLNRSILDTGWRQFRTMLEYKAQWYGRQLTVIDRWYPSSQWGRGRNRCPPGTDLRRCRRFLRRSQGWPRGRRER